MAPQGRRAVLGVRLRNGCEWGTAPLGAPVAKE